LGINQAIEDDVDCDGFELGFVDCDGFELGFVDNKTFFFLFFSFSK
jgi:hypothetical protein